MGKYRRKPIDFSKFRVSRFAPYLFTECSGGCGANALALITGVHPEKIHNTNKENESDWRDSFMLAFLRHRKYNVIPLTMCSASQKAAFADSIDEKHVMLTSQLIDKKLASWQVIFDNYVFHNFGISGLKSREFINNPIMTAYIVFHHHWRIKKKKMTDDDDGDDELEDIPLFPRPENQRPFLDRLHFGPY